MTRYTLRRRERIKRSASFISIYQKGQKKESRHFKIAILANNLPWSRLGLTVSKKIGKAVQRNLLKRRLREYFRLHKNRLPVSSDIVFTAKPGANNLRSADIVNEINGLLQTADQGLNADT